MLNKTHRFDVMQESNAPNASYQNGPFSPRKQNSGVFDRKTDRPNPKQRNPRSPHHPDLQPNGKISAPSKYGSSTFSLRVILLHLDEQ